MTIKKTATRTAGLAGALAISMLSANFTANAADSKLDLKIERMEAITEIQNVMGRRMFYHSIGGNELELGLWAKKHEVRWAQNQGCWVGMKSLKVYYDDVNRKMQAAELKHLSEVNSAIKNVPENRYIGNTVVHALTTPIIEVAGDGQSAKGVWYTTGVILSPGDGKTPVGTWIWERYGIDFVKEDGQWRILNAQVNTDFGTPMGDPLTIIGPRDAAGNSSPAAMGKEGAATPPSGAVVVPGPDIAKPTFEAYSVTRVPTITPRLPEPYSTLSQTFQYATCQ